MYNAGQALQGGTLALIWLCRAISIQPDRIRLDRWLCGEPCQKKGRAGPCCKEVATCYEITDRGAHICGAFHEEAIDGASCDTHSENDGQDNQDKDSGKGKESVSHLEGRSRSDVTILGTAAPEGNGTRPKEIDGNAHKKFACETNNVSEDHGMKLLVDLGASRTQSETNTVQSSEQEVVHSENQLEDPPVRPPCGHCGRPCHPKNTSMKGCPIPGRHC